MTIHVDLSPPTTPQEADAQTGGMFLVAAYMAEFSRRFQTARRFSIGAAGCFAAAGLRDAARIAGDQAPRLRRLEAVLA